MCHDLLGGGSTIFGSTEVRVGTGGALHEGWSEMWHKVGVGTQGTRAKLSILSEAKSIEAGMVSDKVRGE